MTNLEVIKQWLGSGSINIFGLPYAGKDTQCDVLTGLLEAKTFGSGAIFREQQDNTTLQEIMATGALIPSDMFFDIVLPYFAKIEFKDKPLILSSIGRMEGEETVIFKATSQSGHPTKAVVYLDTPESAVWQRYEVAHAAASRGMRQDDADKDILKNRISKFNAHTQPVLEFYRSKGLLVTVDGTQSPEHVTQAILDGLLQKASS